MILFNLSIHHIIRTSKTYYRAGLKSLTLTRIVTQGWSRKNTKPIITVREIPENIEKSQIFGGISRNKQLRAAQIEPTFRPTFWPTFQPTCWYDLLYT